MSSEESDMEGMEIVYRVKVLVWRRDIKRYLEIIDNERIFEADSIFSASGSKPIKRVRNDDEDDETMLASSRKPVIGLPVELYNPHYLKEMGDQYELTLNVSKEQFRWIKISVKSAKGEA